MHRSALRAEARDYANQSEIPFKQNGQRYRFVDAQFNTAPANVYDSQFYGSPILQTSGGGGAGSAPSIRSGWRSSPRTTKPRMSAGILDRTDRASRSAANSA